MGRRFGTVVGILLCTLIAAGAYGLMRTGALATVPISAEVQTVGVGQQQLVEVTLSSEPRIGSNDAEFRYVVLEMGTDTVVETGTVLTWPAGSEKISVPPTQNQVLHVVQVKTGLTKNYTVLVCFEMPTGTGIGSALVGGGAFHVLK